MARKSSARSEFIKVVREVADEIRAREPYLEAQRQQEIKKIQHQQFLNEAAIAGFSHKQAQFMWEYIARKVN